MTELTKEQAIKIAKEFNWIKISHLAKFLFQINQAKLCMNFNEFHQSTEIVLQRPVFTHEFANPELLLMEYFDLEVKP